MDDDDRRLVEGLRTGDEAVFMELVERWGPAMVRVAQIYVRSRAVAEEVVQEAWLGVLNGIDKFEGRSSLKTWVFRIVSNRAKTRGQREARSVPFSALAAHDEPSVDPDRFREPDHERVPGHWDTDGHQPGTWGGDDPVERLLAGEAMDRLREAIEQLSPSQRAVITLRDVEGWDSAEVRNALEISETNQRVLLHRARSKVRAALESYFDAEGGDAP